MSQASDRALAHLCIDLQYTLDQEGGNPDAIQGVLTHVRYQGILEVDHFDVISRGRVVRITAEDIGPHQHTYDVTGHCPDCSDAGVVTLPSS